MDDLDNLSKSDFLPLIPQNIKQELFDTSAEGNLCDSVEKQASFNEMGIEGCYLGSLEVFCPKIDLMGLNSCSLLFKS